MFRFFTYRLKNSIFEHFATEALYERSIQNSKHKGLLIYSPYTTNVICNPDELRGLGKKVRNLGSM